MPITPAPTTTSDCGICLRLRIPSESRIDSSSNSMAGGRTGRLPVAITMAPASTTCLRPSANEITTVSASTKLADSVEDRHVVAGELVADDVGLALRSLPAERVRRSSIVMSSLTRIALPVDRALHEAGQVEHGLAQRLGGDRPAEDAAAAELRPLHDRAAPAELGRLDRGLLAGRAAADREQVEVRRGRIGTAKALSALTRPLVWRISPENSCRSGESARSRGGLSRARPRAACGSRPPAGRRRRARRTSRSSSRRMRSRVSPDASATASSSARRPASYSPRASASSPSRATAGASGSAASSLRAIRPSASRSCSTGRSSSSASSSRPSASRMRASCTRTSARVGSSSIASRSDCSSPAASSASDGLGTQPLDEALDDRGRLRAGELVHELAVAEGLDVRDALDAVAARDARIRVDVDLDQLDGAVGGGHGALDHGREHVARAAPLGPEVDQHRHAARALDDRLLEPCLVDVDRHIHAAA